MRVHYLRPLQQPLQQVHNQTKKLRNQTVSLEVFLEMRKVWNLQKLISQRMISRKLNKNLKKNIILNLSKQLLTLKHKRLKMEQSNLKKRKWQIQVHKNKTMKENLANNQNKRKQRRKVRKLRKKIKNRINKNKNRNKVVGMCIIQQRKMPINSKQKQIQKKNKIRKKYRHNPKLNKTYKLKEKAPNQTLNPSNPNNKTHNHHNPKK